MAFPDAWEEVAFCSISAQSGSDQEFATITETIDIDTGEKGGEGIPSISGGRIWKIAPETDSTITFEGYPLTVGKAPVQSDEFAKGVAQMFHELKTNWDATEPLSVSNTRQREKYRVAILWTNEPEYPGTNTGVTETSLTDTTMSATWVASNLIGKTVQMTTGTASGKTYRITANTTTTLTCAGATMIADGTATGDKYKVLHSGKGCTSSGYEGYRYRISNARMISCKPSFTDGILKLTFAFKIPAFNKDGSANITEESGDGTTSPSLPDLGNYT